MQSPYRYFTRFPLGTQLFRATRPRLPPSLRFPFEIPYAPLSAMVTAGLICTGEGGTRYRLVRPLGTQIRGKIPNVWLAIDDSNAEAEYVVKRPSEDDTSEGPRSSALTAFKHELEIQRLFSKDPMIRSLVDYVPGSEPCGPMMVLEAFTDLLWEARYARLFTAKEIKWIMKGILLGIFTVHMKGMVYTGKSKVIRRTQRNNIFKTKT